MSQSTYYYSQLIYGVYIFLTTKVVPVVVKSAAEYTLFKCTAAVIRRHVISNSALMGILYIITGLTDTTFC